MKIPMHKTLLTVAAVGIAVLAFAGTASANAPANMGYNAIGYAESYWSERGGSTTCDIVQPRFHPMSGRKLGYVWSGKPGHECDINLNSRLTWTWSKLCTVVTHEYGHVVGKHHSNKRSSIMWPSWPNPVWGETFAWCAR